METPRNYLIDMDGVIISGNALIPGADDFIKRLKKGGLEHLVLTNTSIYTPRDLAHRLQSLGLEIPARRIFTSALATARFSNPRSPTARPLSSARAG